MQELSGFTVPKGFRGAGGIKVQLWWAVQATLFAWSPQILYRWRVFLLRLFGAKIGKNVVIRPSVKITYPWKLTIGDYAWVGDDAVLYTPSVILPLGQIPSFHRNVIYVPAATIIRARILILMPRRLWSARNAGWQRMSSLLPASRLATAPSSVHEAAFLNRYRQR